MPVARISGFGGDPRSGLAYVYFEDEWPVLVESGYGLRAFAQAFGSLQASVGRVIEYSVDWLGIMEGFTPIEETA